MRLLAFDFASHITGVCCGDGSEPAFTEALEHPEVTTKEGADYGLLLSSVYVYMQSAFRRWPDIGAVGYEQPLLITKSKNRKYGDKLSTLRLLYPMGAFCEWACRDVFGVPCHEIPVKEAKAEVTGNANAKKEAVAFVAEKCSVKLPVIGRLDCGDAWSVWARMLRSYDPEAAELLAKRIYGPRVLV